MMLYNCIFRVWPRRPTANDGRFRRDPIKCPRDIPTNAQSVCHSHSSTVTIDVVGTLRRRSSSDKRLSLNLFISSVSPALARSVSLSLSSNPAKLPQPSINNRLGLSLGFYAVFVVIVESLNRLPNDVGGDGAFNSARACAPPTTRGVGGRSGPGSRPNSYLLRCSDPTRRNGQLSVSANQTRVRTED